MFYPFLVADPRSGLHYRRNDATPAKLALAPKAAEWVPGRAVVGDPVLAHSPEGADIPGTIDLLARGLKGRLLIKRKTGGSGKILGFYWSHLSTYAELVAKQSRQNPLHGVALLSVDHGRVNVVKIAKTLNLADHSGAR